MNQGSVDRAGIIKACEKADLVYGDAQEAANNKFYMVGAINLQRLQAEG
jgi:hypothetical protein